MRRLGPPVADVQGRDGLRKHFPDELLGEAAVALTAGLDRSLQVAAVAVLHDDVDICGGLVDESPVVLDDVLVLQPAEDVDLRDDLLLLLLVHLAVVQLLPDEGLAVADAPDLLHAAEAALAYVRNDLVLLLILLIIYLPRRSHRGCLLASNAALLRLLSDYSPLRGGRILMVPHFIPRTGFLVHLRKFFI